jgi:hypothetical protein
MVKIAKATRKFESWLGKQIPLIPADLALKHRLMAHDAFTFLRATFYRWAQVWPEVCPELARGPRVLAVGDLHVENFGTWRDAEGRLVWGANDFDETYPMAYTNDLVRLAVSANLAITSRHIKITPDRACKAIAQGYLAGLRSGGLPFVLSERHRWVREAAMGELRDPVRFWAKMVRFPAVDQVPGSARKALESLLPAKDLEYKLLHRISGVGSLGRERFVALAELNGGMIAREAKAAAPSACVWAGKGGGSKRILYEEILESACRALDPFVRLRGRWIIRRLAPDCSRIELTSLPKKVDEKRLLEAMGFETANIHLGSKDAAKAVRTDFSRRRPGWLQDAMKAMNENVLEDFESWRSK